MAFTPIPNLSGAQRSAMMGIPSAHYLLPHQPAQVPELPRNRDLAYERL